MTDTIDTRAHLDFVLALRRRWADTIYPHVRGEFQHASASDAPDPGLETRVHDLPSYPWFAWLERGSQKMLWRAVEDVTRDDTDEHLDALAPATLQLDPHLVLPQWYTQWDIHLQPGGIWSTRAAAATYELGAKLVMLGENDDYKFHRLFVDTALPVRRYHSIIDLGCGFGKSTWPLKKRFPQAEVIGIDLSEPCLRLSAHRAGQQDLAIHFRQADATATDLESGTMDLVTSTMLVHELPLELMPALFVEASRLLRAGGVLRFLDFQRTGDEFRDLAMLEHGSRNNEPYMAPMLLADLVTMARDAGLDDVRWMAFDERNAGRLPDLVWPTRREWHFPWAVLEAEKSA